MAYSLRPPSLRSRAWLAATAILTLTVLLGPYASTAQDTIPPDENYQARQQKVLLNLAGELNLERDFGDRGMVRFAREMVNLLACLEVHDRGIGDGRTPEQAEEILRTMVPHCIEMLGTVEDPGPWSWEKSGSPAIKHAALALAMMVHRWGDKLSPDVVETIRQSIADTSWKTSPSRYLVNGRLSVNAAQLLMGEYLGYDSPLWQEGVKNFNTMYEHTMTCGGLEMNAPVYTVYHWPPLVMLCDLKNEEFRAKARILLDYQLTVHGHLFLPGGGLGAPQSRDRSGGTRQRGTLPQMFWLFFGDEAAPYGPSWHQILAAGRSYRPPRVLRSLFIDKPQSGYSFWAYTTAPVRGRMPGTGYILGPQDAPVAPWQAVMMPDGKVQMGMSYGHRYQAIHVSMGVYAKDDQGDFQILYQQQPWVKGDTGPPQPDGRRRGLPSASDSDPDDFIREGYEYERLMYGRTMLSIWNPQHTKHQDTRVHLPNWDRHGGDLLRAGKWYVGRMNQSYIAYLPLGEIAVEEPRNDGAWTYLRLDGPSGCIIELATTDQFDTLADYAAHLQQRDLAFSRDPLQVSFEALKVGTKDGETVPLHLEFRPERRLIDGREVTLEDLDRGFIDSPFVTWSWGPRTMRLHRPGYDTVTYHVDQARIEE